MDERNSLMFQNDQLKSEANVISKQAKAYRQKEKQLVKQYMELIKCIEDDIVEPSNRTKNYDYFMYFIVVILFVIVIK
ncbi:hypothetical protein SS50377_21890 [Spironucleus salmonicida]|uniref:Uncharacterized protein n=1 Tax=Spironucleus salmonicida TaxID=348837 RepID=A0A9P8LYJ8_9EUKA|nr:hypothetical protein SS50377_21890 [Spironucleus salmonicida]